MSLIFKTDVKTHIEGILFDTVQNEYYNHHTDIYLTDDDIEYMNLKPYSELTSPLPKPLPKNYFEYTKVDQTYPTK